MTSGIKILLTLLTIMVILSVSSTYYRSVVLQDFELTGVWMEFYENDSTYVWYFYANEEYELEVESTEYDVIMTEIAQQLNTDIDFLDKDFLDTYSYAYSEAEYATEEETLDSNEETNEEHTSATTEPDLEPSLLSASSTNEGDTIPNATSSQHMNI